MRRKTPNADLTVQAKDTEEYVLVPRSLVEIRLPPHWTCKTHGDFDAMREVGCPECTRLMRQALLRAYDDHGHRYNCSAARGMNSDCTCGWLKVMELVKQMRKEK